MTDPYRNDIYYNPKRKRNQGSVEHEHGTKPEIPLPQPGQTLIGGDDPEPAPKRQLSLAEELWPDETMGYDFMVRKRQDVEKTLHFARAALADTPKAPGGGVTALNLQLVRAVQEAERDLERINDSIAKLFNPAYHAPKRNQDYDRRESASGLDARLETSSALGGTLLGGPTAAHAAGFGTADRAALQTASPVGGGQATQRAQTTVAQKTAGYQPMDDILFKGDKSFSNATQQKNALQLPNTAGRDIADGQPRDPARDDIAAGLMHEYVRAARQGNLPMLRLDNNDARHLATAMPKLSPEDMLYTYKAMREAGYSSRSLVGFDLTPEQKAALVNLMSGGESMDALDTGPGSMFDNVIEQSEGKESEDNKPGSIKVVWNRAQDELTGKIYKASKMYRVYNDGRGNLTVGHGVLVTDEVKALDKNWTPGEPWNWKEALIAAEDIDAIQAKRTNDAKDDVKALFPYASFLGKGRQTGLVDLAFNMGRGNLAGFKEFRKYLGEGDFWSAGLEVIRSERSETTGARNLFTALIILTDGHPSLFEKNKLNNLKIDVDKRLNEEKQNKTGKGIREVMEEMYRKEAAKLGFSPKTKQ